MEEAAHYLDVLEELARMTAACKVCSYCAARGQKICDEFHITPWDGKLI